MLAASCNDLEPTLTYDPCVYV